MQKSLSQLKKEEKYITNLENELSETKEDNDFLKNYVHCFKNRLNVIYGEKIFQLKTHTYRISKKKERYTFVDSNSYIYYLKNEILRIRIKNCHEKAYISLLDNELSDIIRDGIFIHFRTAPVTLEK